MMRMGGKEIGQLPGLKYRLRRLRNGFAVQPLHWSDRADEAWADSESLKYGGRDSPYWRQNYEMELIRGGELVFPMLRRAIHVREILRAEYLSADWTVWRALDHGIHHPTCCAWAAVHKNRDRYFFRQLYVRDTPIPVVAKRIVESDGPDEDAQGTVADPSIWQRSPTLFELETFAEVYARHGLPLVRADNHKSGYETLRAGFLSSVARWALGRRKVDVLRDMLSAPLLTVGDAERLADAPAIWFHPSCASGAESLYEQCANLRYRPHRNPEHTAEPTMPEDKDDEGPDVVRYMCHSAVVQWRRPVGLKGRDLIRELMERPVGAGKERPTW